MNEVKKFEVRLIVCRFKVHRLSIESVKYKCLNCEMDYFLLVSFMLHLYYSLGFTGGKLFKVLDWSKNAWSTTDYLSHESWLKDLSKIVLSTKLMFFLNLLGGSTMQQLNYYSGYTDGKLFKVLDWSIKVWSSTYCLTI